MTKHKNTSPKKDPGKKAETTDQQSFTAIGVVFFIAGVGMLASESTRMVSIPFLSLGATFFILGQQKTPKRKK